MMDLSVPTQNQPWPGWVTAVREGSLIDSPAWWVQAVFMVGIVVGFLAGRKFQDALCARASINSEFRLAGRSQSVPIPNRDALQALRDLVDASPLRGASG